MKNEKQILIKILAAITVAIIAGYSYLHYLQLRSAGATSADAVISMIFTFLFITLIVGATAAFVWLYAIPQGIKIFRGIKAIRTAKPAKVAETPSQDTLTELQSQLTDYSNTTFAKLLSSSQLEILRENIGNFISGKGIYTSVETSNQKVGITILDAAHFGWNIGKRIIPTKGSRKFGIETALFIKQTFPVTLQESTVETLITRLRDQNGKFSLPLIEVKQPLCPHVFQSNTKGV